MGNGLMMSKPGELQTAAMQEKYAAHLARDKALAPQMLDGNRIKATASGFKIGDVKVGATVQGVIVGQGFCQDFYDPSKKYDPLNPEPPWCHARSLQADTLTPFETSPKPQNKTCEGCEFREFKSAENGKGKACRESIALSIVHPDDIADGTINALKAFTLSIPPTGLKSYTEQMINLLDVLKLPMFTAVFEFEIVDLPAGFSIKTTLLGVIEDSELLDTRIVPLLEKEAEKVVRDPEYDYGDDGGGAKASGKPKAPPRKEKF